MLYTIHSLPRAAQSLPGFAVGAFIDHANVALRAGLPDRDAIAVGMNAAALDIERREMETQRSDKAGARVARVDRVELRLDASTVVRHDNGWIDVWGVATRVGVFDYDEPSMPDGVFREYRPPEEVLAADSLASLHGVPFTVDHPAGEVDSANSRELVHGWVLEVRPEGDLVWTRIRVASDDALAAIQAGKLELSCGYTLRLEESAGGVTPDGEPYDAIQRDIRYNHLALVDMARAGHVAKLRFDSLRVQRTDSGKRAPMRKFKLTHDGKTVECLGVMLSGLRTAHIDTARDKKARADLKTAAVRIEMEGDEPLDLVLPEPMVMEIMSMFGGGGAAPAEEVETTVEEPAADEPGAEAAPPAEQLPTPPDEEAESEDMGAHKRGDADTVKRADVEAMIAKALAGERARSDAAAKERAGVERQASRVLDLGFAYDAHSTAGIQVEAIAVAAPSRADAARDLAKKADAGDARAAGALDAMFSMAVEAAAEDRQREVDAAAGETNHDGVQSIEDARQKRADKLRKGRSRHA